MKVWFPSRFLSLYSLTPPSFMCLSDAIQDLKQNVLLLFSFIQLLHPLCPVLCHCSAVWSHSWLCVWYHNLYMFMDFITFDIDVMSCWVINAQTTLILAEPPDHVPVIFYPSQNLQTKSSKKDLHNEASKMHRSVDE